ncbi:MAG: cytochrome c oxidase assembly protein [Xanthobacteraceae bacterium]
MSRAANPSARRRDLIVAAACGVFVAGMVGLAYASVPFYDWFCRVTGFGGRPQIATSAPQGIVGRTVSVRFDANVTGGLPWRFEPEQNSINVKLGEVVTVNFVATNLAARETLGQAAYNVAPATTGSYFQKINCFCFTEQRLGPGEKREMPVVFYIDPSLAKDAELDDLNTITLSYSFYAMREPPKPVADRGAKSATN